MACIKAAGYARCTERYRTTKRRLSALPARRTASLISVQQMRCVVIGAANGVLCCLYNWLADHDWLRADPDVWDACPTIAAVPDHTPGHLLNRAAIICEEVATVS